MTLEVSVPTILSTNLEICCVGSGRGPAEDEKSENCFGLFVFDEHVSVELEVSQELLLSGHSFCRVCARPGFGTESNFLAPAFEEVLQPIDDERPRQLKM